MWVKDHKFLAVWRGVRIMPPFQGFSVNQICTSINLSWEHLAQKKLWCISDVVHGVGGVLAEVHSTAVISYPGNENIISKETAWCHTRWLNQPALAQSRRIKPRQGDESDDGARRSKNWFDQRQRKKLSIGSRVQSFPHAIAFLFDVALRYYSESTKELLPRILPNDTHIDASEITKVLGKDGPLPYRSFSLSRTKK